MINCGYISISFDEGGVTGARLSVYNYCRPQVAYVQYIIREKPSVFERAVAVSHRILLDKTVILGLKKGGRHTGCCTGATLRLVNCNLSQ